MDQVLIAVVLFGINLIVPFLVTTELAADILYQTSWVVLWGVVTASLFGVPLLSNSLEGDRWVVREVLMIYFLFSAFVSLFLCLLGLFFNVEIEKLVSFFTFIFVWGGVELVRKSFLMRDKIIHSFLVSLAYVFSVSVGLCFLYLTHNKELFWLASTFGVGLLIMFVFLESIFLKGRDEKRDLILIFAHAKNIFCNGGYTFLSYMLVWVATQGVFVLFFGNMSSDAFVEQKWLFSLFGISSVLMSVQENKYQPAFAAAMKQQNYIAVRGLNEKIKIENLFIFGVLVCVGLLAYNYSESISIVPIIMLLIYRQFFSAAKRLVYFLRGSGHYKEIMLANLFSCVLCYISIMATTDISDYAVSFGFAVYGAVFYGASFLLCHKLRDIEC